MYKPTRNVYTIRTSPYNDNEKLENLLNEMSKDGWEVYSIQEIENDEGIFYNCIFIKETENEDNSLNENDDLLNFKSRIERIINPELDPYELCVDIQKKIKEKRQKIAQVKSLIDETSEDSRAILNDEISKHIDELDDLKKKLSKVINPNIMEQKLGEQKLTLSISEELMDILDNDNEYNMLAQIVLIRQNLTESLGYIIPKIKIEVDDTLDENEFAIKVRGIPVITSKAYCDYTMFYENDLKIEKLPDNSFKSTDTVTGLNTIWIREERAKDFWAKGLDTTDYIAHLIEYTVTKYIDDIFDYSDINRYIEIVGNQNLYLIENIIPDYMSVAELKYILTSLIKEKVSIKDIVYIFEKINDFADETNKEELLERIRVSLARQISASICNDNDKSIYAYELSANSIKSFIGDKNVNDEVIRIESTKIEEIIKNLKEKVEQYTPEAKEIILIAPMKVRHIIYLILSQMIPNLRVIAREELLFEYPLNIICTI
ncbi:TPA: FHIPEP family type III secretion protein [Candidatus Avigastranaerophilus faecigallinarum]|nr:FHIPEP family type III secretion protein [Candidatus Avigastranaerophilus faecigallinarum]